MTGVFGDWGVGECCHLVRTYHLVTLPPCHLVRATSAADRLRQRDRLLLGGGAEFVVEQADAVFVLAQGSGGLTGLGVERHQGAVGRLVEWIMGHPAPGIVEGLIEGNPGCGYIAGGSTGNPSPVLPSLGRAQWSC